MRTQLAFQPTFMRETFDKREKCTAECFIPRRGATDQIYCIEKCNQAFDTSLGTIEKSVKEQYAKRQSGES